jgi:hypothetical protein
LEPDPTVTLASAFTTVSTPRAAKSAAPPINE